MSSVWVEAARPRTLPAGISPVLVGTAAADRFIAWRFGAALVVAIAVQVTVNFANDLFDARRGIDTAGRTGPRRMVASGLIAPSHMGLAVVIALGVAAVAGAALAAAAGYELLLVGLAAFAATLTYSGGPLPYASAGLGEVFVFVFFGVVATAGSAYVQDEHVAAAPLVASVPMGMLASAILVANNLRDIATDAAAGKRTLAVRLGSSGTRILYRTLLCGAFAGPAALAWINSSPGPLIAFASVVLVPGPWRMVTSDAAPLLIDLLAATARLELIFGLLLAVGLWVS